MSIGSMIKVFRLCFGIAFSFDLLDKELSLGACFHFMRIHNLVVMYVDPY